MHSILQKLQNIIVGHTGGDVTTDLHEERLRVCYGCIYNTKQHEGFGGCRYCKCPIVAKSRVTNEHCQRWTR